MLSFLHTKRTNTKESPCRYLLVPLVCLVVHLCLASCRTYSFTNFNVIRSDSPIARYFGLSASATLRRFGGNVHTPPG